MTKTAKPYDMSKAKEKPSLRGLFSTMVIKGPSSKPKKKMMDEEEEDMSEMESEGMDEEEMTESEHVEAAKEGASELRSALESDDKEAAMAALDKIESHLEQCAA
jgi:hypothetical protein